MPITSLQMEDLQKTISEAVALLGEKSNSLYQSISPIKINSLSPVFPILNDASLDTDNLSSVENTSVSLDNLEFKPGIIHQQSYEKIIPFALKRATEFIDNSNGNILVNYVAKGIADTLFLKQELNLKKAMDTIEFTNGKNIFNAGNIHSDTAAVDFRTNMNMAMQYLKKEVSGISTNRKIIMFANDKAWAKLTGSQKLVNFFNGYGERSSNLTTNTIETIFSDNSQTPVTFKVADMRYTQKGTNNSTPVWGEDESIYLFMSSNDPIGDKKAVKRLEGISEIRVWEEGLKTKFECYLDFGYVFESSFAFARVDFVNA